MDVSPHLRIGTPLVGITPRAMRQARENLEGLYEFAVEQVEAVRAAGRWPIVGRGDFSPEGYGEQPISC